MTPLLFSLDASLAFPIPCPPIDGYILLTFTNSARQVPRLSILLLAGLRFHLSCTQKTPWESGGLQQMSGSSFSVDSATVLSY